jgi:hypothetical protein
MKVKMNDGNDYTFSIFAIFYAYYVVFGVEPEVQRKRKRSVNLVGFSVPVIHIKW